MQPILASTSHQKTWKCRSPVGYLCLIRVKLASRAGKTQRKCRIILKCALAYLRLTKRGWRNHLIFEAFLWSAQGNQHINSIELDRLLLSSSAVADWMCKSTQVNQFKFNYVGYSAPHGEIVCVDTLKHDEAWCWKTTIRNILSWSFLLVLLLCAPLDVGTLLVRGSQY